MENEVKLVKAMYPCQDVPVVVLKQRCTKPCLYCDLYQKEFSDDETIAVGIKDVLEKLADFKGAYFSAVTDCFLKENRDITHYLIENIWKLKKDFVPLIVTKQQIPLKTQKLLINNKHRCVVQISIPSINEKLISILEPGSLSVSERLKMINSLTSEGVPVIAVVMPWLDVYEDNETIDDLPRALDKVGVQRCLIGTGVLPQKQSQKMMRAGNPLIIDAVRKMTKTQKVTTKTGETLPLRKKIAAFGRLITVFNMYGIKARVCTADNPDLFNNNFLPHCTKFKHHNFK